MSPRHLCPDRFAFPAVVTSWSSFEASPCSKVEGLKQCPTCVLFAQIVPRSARHSAISTFESVFVHLHWSQFTWVFPRSFADPSIKRLRRIIPQRTHAKTLGGCDDTTCGDCPSRISKSNMTALHAKVLFRNPQASFEYYAFRTFALAVIPIILSMTVA